MILRSAVLLSAYLSMDNSFADSYKLSPAKIPNVSFSTYDANSPSEDRLILHDAKSWKLFGVLDGHGGWQVSNFVQQKIVEEITLNLSNVPLTDAKCGGDIDDAIYKSFENTEEDYARRVKPAFELGFGDVSSIGSCVLLALKYENQLIIANCGDSRAVLGSAISRDIPNTNKKNVDKTTHSIHALALSNDHNARMPLEVALLKSAHPDEPNIVQCKHPDACYVKGRLQVK